MKHLLLSVQSFFRKKIPLYHFITLLLIAVGALSWKNVFLVRKKEPVYANPEHHSSAGNSAVNFVRLSDYHFTGPLLMANIPNESPDFENLKSSVDDYFRQKQSSGEIINAAVYLKRLSNGSWMSVNGNQPFNLGSMFKVLCLITYLKESELDPMVLNKKLSMSPSDPIVPNQEYMGDTIVRGKPYAVKDLLNYMITQSDNNATVLLNNNINMQLYSRMFTDLGLPQPDIKDPNFQMDAVNFSRFLRVLYNASYLNIHDSEYALSLLSKSTFKDGIVKGVPADVVVSHKFGEKSINGSHQLHESGIVYLQGNPYLLIVLTMGNDEKKLPEIMSNTSAMIYRFMDQQNKN